MSFKYSPRDAVQCLPAGDYQATIEKAEEGVSKTSGNDMLTITYKAYAGNRVQFVYDYITTAMAWKLKKIAKAIGKLAAFDKGEFIADDYVGENLTLTLKVESDPQYGDKNVVKDYKPKDVKATNGLGIPLHESEKKDESIPF